jgi:hypothetical protein
MKPQSSISKRLALLSGTALALLLLASPAAGQEASPNDEEEQQAPAEPLDEYYEGDGEDIVVVGNRLPGSVVGDIPPENIFDARDIRATGATDITEVLEALEPEIGSARGRGGERPVMLLNGQRISSFRELRDIPSEAILRVEILPEEVALKYGYRADQRVVNFVLRPRFRSTVAELEAGTATEGGTASGEAEASRLIIDRNGRTTINLEAERNGALTEAERDIELEAGEPDERSARTLVGSRTLLRGNATVNRQLGQVSATLNTELEHNEGRSLLGLSDFALEPLVRDTSSDSVHAGIAINGDRGRWRWTLTGNGDVVRSVTRTDRSDETLFDKARTTRGSADVDLVANGPLFAVPAGDASATFRAGASTLHLDSHRRSAGDSSANDLSRNRGSVAANFDLPISRRNRGFSALGNLTLNANGELEQLSDFGTLTTVGAGLNWSPLDRLDLIASWTREEGAPSIQQLGDPVLETPDARIFDFTRGETALVTAITGGNPLLASDRRNVLKLGANWKPMEESDLRIRGEYVRSVIDDPIASFPGPSAAIEAAFPERFVRDEDGELTRVDLRPVNFDKARRETLRWGFSYSKPLRSEAPSREAIERFRARSGVGPAREGQQRQGSSDQHEGEGEVRTRRGGGGGFGRFGGRGGGRNRGRLQLSVAHTLNLVDEVTIRPGVPELDYLGGDAIGAFGGRPRHEVEARAGWFNNGLGARLSAEWRSGTEVDSLDGEDLEFSSLAKFDLRLFANLGERFDLVSRHPWLRGSSVRLQIDNIFDAKPKVRNAAGELPLSHQPDLLDPLGRTISISFRKLFLPPPRFFRRSGQDQR